MEADYVNCCDLLADWAWFLLLLRFRFSAAELDYKTLRVIISKVGVHGSGFVTREEAAEVVFAENFDVLILVVVAHSKSIYGLSDV